MHGAPRTPTWTQMYETSNAGSKQITLKEAVDWKVGEYIVIASTTFSGRDAEKRQITEVDKTNEDRPIIKFA